MKGEQSKAVPCTGFFKLNEGAEKWAGEQALKQAQEHPQALPPSGVSFENSQAKPSLQKELSPRIWST